MPNHNVTVMNSSIDMDYATPQKFVDDLPFDFDVDVCASRENAKARHWITKASNALVCDWRYSQNQTYCWMNPPYGRGIGAWIEKAHQESLNQCTVVALIPNRTEKRWFRRVWSDASLICFVGQQIKLLHPDPNKEKDRAPYANVLTTFGRLEKPEYIAEELSHIGTVILPGAGNIWLHGSEELS